jgi:hypothetical protein
MEETATVNFQLAAAQAPVGAQQKMVLEYCVLDFIESAPADEAEIGDVFLLLAGVDSPAFASPAKLERNRTDMLGGDGANQPDTDTVT